MEAIRKPLRLIFMAVEGTFDRIFGEAWNPFYCLGALGYFYFWIVAGSGIYIYIFFDTGVPQAYESVEYMTNEQWYLAGVMRSLHRYASDALVVMMMGHMLRVFAYGRYNGARWFSWITGVPMIWLVMIAGITGYWLVWDKLAQYVAIGATEWLDWLPIFGEPVARNFLSPSHLDGRFFTLMVFLHIAVPLILLFVMWFHLQRVGHAKINPARGLAIGTGLMMVILSLVWPATSQGIANLSEIASPVSPDWFYLAWFPLMDAISAGPMWGIAVFGTIVLFLVPWLPPAKKQPAALVDLDNCNGCNRCVIDCPFSAISLMPRSDDAPFTHEARVDDDLCVSCGICVGSCPTATPFRRTGALVPGIDLPGLSLADLRARTDAAGAILSGPGRVLVFGCEHGLRSEKFTDGRTAAVILPCTGMLPPAFIDYVISRGLADGVAVTGCRPGECHYRQGQRWLSERIAGERDPRLRRRVPRERVAEIWAAPIEGNRFERELEAFRAELPAAGGGTPPLPDKVTEAAD